MRVGGWVAGFSARGPGSFETMASILSAGFAFRSGAREISANKTSAILSSIPSSSRRELLRRDREKGRETVELSFTGGERETFCWILRD